MQRIKSSDLKVGVKFSSSAYVDVNNLFLEANVPLTQEYINILVDWGIDFVETKGLLLQPKDYIPPKSDKLDIEDKPVIREHEYLEKKKEEKEQEEIKKIADRVADTLIEKDEIDISTIDELVNKVIQQKKLHPQEINQLFIEDFLSVNPEEELKGANKIEDALGIDISDIEDEENEITNGSDYKDLSNNIVGELPERLTNLHKFAAASLKSTFYNIKDGKKFNVDMIKEPVNEIMMEIERDRNAIINLARYMPAEDYLISHSVNVCIISLALGSTMKFSRVKLMSLGIGALLHDIGMIQIPSNIVNKKGKLSPEEFNKIKTHPLLGYKIIIQYGNFSRDIAATALDHHEEFNGKGYPRKLKGNQISEFGRIVALVNSYEAMTKRRAYRDEYGSYDAMRSILREGQNKYDPRIIKLFLNLMALYPVGSVVQLNDNSIAEVISADTEQPLKPTVKILVDSDGKKTDNKEVIRLTSNKDLVIIKALEKNHIKQMY